MTPLLHLHNSDITEMIKFLVQGNAIVNARDHDGRTTLSRAVEVGKEPMVQLLLQHSGTRVNLQDKNGVTPLHLAPCTLHLAAVFKRFELAEMLILASTDFNECDFRNATPLHYAAYAGSPEVVSLLLENGADPKLTDTDGHLAAHCALSRHNLHTAASLKYPHDVAKMPSVIRRQRLARQLMTLFKASQLTAAHSLCLFLFPDCMETCLTRPSYLKIFKG